jgi:hypothetical protein
LLGEKQVRSPKPVFELLVFLTFGGAVCACASLSGLDQYSPGGNASGSSDETAPPHLPDTSVDLPGDGTSRDDDVRAGENGRTISDDLGNDSGDLSVGTEDAGLNADSDGSSDAGKQSDASEADGAPREDASKPVCGSSSSHCGGCCDMNGNCVGGQSTATCGTGGETCVNCGSRSCNNGACSTIASDAGRCTQTSCNVFTTLCIPVYESPCCKSDGTCSCNINFPPGPCL